MRKGIYTCMIYKIYIFQYEANQFFYGLWLSDCVFMVYFKRKYKKFLWPS